VVFAHERGRIPLLARNPQRESIALRVDFLEIQQILVFPGIQLGRELHEPPRGFHDADGTGNEALGRLHDRIVEGLSVIGLVLFVRHRLGRLYHSRLL